jgi:hypothetical protein
MWHSVQKVQKGFSGRTSGRQRTTAGSEDPAVAFIKTGSDQ